MKILCSRSFKIAQQISREAVENGSKEGYEYDWQIAMTYLKIAIGHIPVDQLERIIMSIEASKKDEG